LLVEAKKLAKITIRGVVQGVGFRPFVYRLAYQHNLKGWVRNTSGDVEIEIEGDNASLLNFLTALKNDTPPIAHIEQIETTYQIPRHHSDFTILESLREAGRYQLISPDIATCRNCLSEIFNPDNRRYLYPFTNCTNCGPRFTIIRDIPYDRPRTTMNKFTMCPECQAEYDDPMNRRFHAQPNACPVCGPNLQLLDNDGVQIETSDALKTACDLLKEGKILAVKGLGGFLLACDATNCTAVNSLRARKKRPSKPFAVMIADTAEAEKHCNVTSEERKMLESAACPIVLLEWAKHTSDISDTVAPNLKYLGVMLPYTPLYYIMLSMTERPLVMTSGNLSEEPIAAENDEALSSLKGIADFFLMHNRDIYARYDDSVFMVEDNTAIPVRRARGYAPYPISLPFKSKQVLACGAEEKNTFCLTKDEYAFVSQHIGDMDNAETFEHLTGTIELYKKLFHIEPEIIAYDMHPDYVSTRYALQKGEAEGLKLVPVQHHHGHIVSCMTENNIQSTVIGVAFDGTGYGPDNTIWGGEFLIADRRRFERAGHLEYVPLPGGTAAIKKPYRMALSYLHILLGEAPTGLPMEYPKNEYDTIKQQINRGINSPLTSSAGRLFDAVAALAGLRGEIDYEAQAAIEMEMAAEGNINKIAPYPFSIVQNGIKIVKLGELISAIVADIVNKVPVSAISLKFHRTVAEIISRTCAQIADDSKLNTVALSGGVFQNRLVLKMTTALLHEQGFDVLTHRLAPCNDGGISLGQAVVANFAE
jgi:hydrogenase maturation protein HypF